MQIKLHSHCAFNGVANIFFSLFAQLAVEALLQHFAVGSDHPERLLEIVRRGIGELFQIGVGTLERFVCR